MNTLKFIFKEGFEYFPIEQLNSIHVFGELTMNKRFFQLLNKYQISVLFYNYFGQCVGSYQPECNRKGNILIQQAMKYTNLNDRNKIVYLFIKAQIANQISLLYYYKKKGYSLAILIDEIKRLEKQFDKTKSNENYVNQAMLFEARIKQIYYQVFDIVLKETEFKFNRRSTRPPKNEINALISFGYTLLYNDVLNAIIQTPLAPEISFIHSATKHGNSLQLDIADMLKSVYIDRLVIRLIKRKQINKSHFTYQNQSCFLNETGKRIFLQEYEKTMLKTVLDKRNNKYYSYRQLLIRECYMLINHITDKKEFIAYRMGW